MKRLVSLIVLGAVLLAACGSGSGVVAATVDGQDVTVGEVEQLIDTNDETVTKEQFAQFLSFQIQWLVMNAAAEVDYGVTTTDEEVAAEADRIYNEVAAQGQSREDFLASRGVTETFLQSIARQGLLDAAIREILKEDVPDPSAEEIETARAEAVTSLTSVCASHILVATQDEADDVFTRLEAGEEFGELAAELSTDTASGANNGVLECSSPDAYVDAFKEAVLIAPIGEVHDEAVQTEFGFHVILVTDRQPPAAADLPTDEVLIDGLRDQAVVVDLEDWFLSSVEAADVTVEAEYGTWQPNPPTVVPPVS
jgi:parvulin-like peptidyl-prolyl isomerase